MNRRKPRAKEPEIETAQPGPQRFTVGRFFADCCDSTYFFLRSQWRQGNQLVAAKVPTDALPAVLILAGYARLYGAELVDDFDVLVTRYDQNIKECFHNDKFLASSISLLHKRGQFPDLEGYETVNVPNIYEELLP